MVLLYDNLLHLLHILVPLHQPLLRGQLFYYFVDVVLLVLYLICVLLYFVFFGRQVFLFPQRGESKLELFLFLPQLGQSLLPLEPLLLSLNDLYSRHPGNSLDSVSSRRTVLWGALTRLCLLQYLLESAVC